MQLLPKNEKDRRYMLLGFRIVGSFGAIIALPVIAFVLLGQYMDAKFGHAPWWTVGGFVTASILTVLIIRKKAKEYGKEYTALNKKFDTKTKNKDSE